MPGRRQPTFVRAAIGGMCLLGAAVLLVLLFDRYKGILGNASDARLSQIGAAIDRYARNHAGAYPASLGELRQDQGLSSQVMLCPETHPWTSDAASTFVYLGRGLTTATAGPVTVVAYDPPAYVGADGRDVLFGDGHTEWVNAADLPAVLARGKLATAPSPQPATGPSVVQSGHG